MIRPCVACAALLLVSAILPATAADWPVRPAYVPPAPLPAPARVKVWAPAPYYVVNQGPVYSGPGFVILDMGFTDTDLKRHYPFIGRFDPVSYRFRGKRAYHHR